MAKHCFTEFCAQNGVDSALDMGEIHRLRLECEDAKKNLATRKVTEVAVSNFRDDMDLQCRMDHELFRRINGEVIARTLQLLQRTVETMRGKGGLGDDYQLLLLGGGSRNVALREAVCQKFESSVNRSVLLYPEVAAAFGAAGLADILAVVPECESLLDARQIAQHYRHLAKALLDAEPSSERFLELARYAKSFVAAKSNVPSPSEWTALQRKVSLSNSNSSKGILKPRPLDDLQGMARVTVRKWQQNGHSSVPSDGEVDIGESDDEEIKPDKPEQGVRCRGFANGPANGGVKVSNRSYSSRVSNGSQSPTDVDCSGVTILRRPDIVKLCVGENDHDDDDDDDWDKTVQDGTCHNYFGGLARGPADPGGRGSSQSSSSRLSNRSQSPSELGNSEGAAVGRSTEAGLEHQWRHRPPKPHDDFAAVIRVDSMNNQRPPAFFKKADRVPRKKSSGGKRRIRGSEKCQIA
ncbi:hypothetical protein BV898_05425 [Hypsibius exemplaris]|nr:hypothetical protein BV898_05425 [Hypsibius exemplaris]